MMAGDTAVCNLQMSQAVELCVCLEFMYIITCASENKFYSLIYLFIIIMQVMYFQ